MGISKGFNVAIGGGNCSPQFRLECEARYWLAYIGDQVGLIIQDSEDYLAMAAADDIERIYREFEKLIIKKRGPRGAQILFIEMMWRWFENDYHPVINAVYRGAETLRDLLMAGAGCDKKGVPIPIQKNRD